MAKRPNNRPYKQTAGLYNELNAFSRHFEHKVDVVIGEVLTIGSRAYREAAERGYDKAMTEVVKRLAEVLKLGGFGNKSGRGYPGAGNLTLKYRQDKEITQHDGSYKREKAKATNTDLREAKERLRKEYLEKYGWTARNNTVKNATAEHLRKYVDPNSSRTTANSAAINAARRDAKNRLATRILSLEKMAELEKEGLALFKDDRFTAPNNFFRGFRYYVKDRGFTTAKKPSPSNLKGDSLITWLEKRTKTNASLNTRLLRNMLGGLESHVYGNPFKYQYKQNKSNGVPLKSPYFAKEDRKGKFSRVKIIEAILPKAQLAEGHSLTANGSVITPSGQRISAVQAAQKGVLGGNVTFTVMSKFYKLYKDNDQNAFMRAHEIGGGSASPLYGGIFGGPTGNAQAIKIAMMATDPRGTHGNIDPFTRAFIGLLDPKTGMIFEYIREELKTLANDANTRTSNSLGAALNIKVK